MTTNINFSSSENNPNDPKDSPDQSIEHKGEAPSQNKNRSRSLLLNIKPLLEVTGRHQRGFDGEGSEGT